MESMEVTSVASWYGSNRMLAHAVGQELRGLELVNIPFAGGMAEVPSIAARTINVNDKHCHVVNCAMVMAHSTLGPKLYRALRREAFHPTSLDDAQQACLAVEAEIDAISFDNVPDELRFAWAQSYFVVAWMTRHATAGTRGEFKAGLSTRWVASGGDSNAHYRGAVRSINAWRRTLARCNFTCLDFREFLAECMKSTAATTRDRKENGIYCDPPFFGPGEKYAHSFSVADHSDLAHILGMVKNMRVVIRYYDAPLIRELYPQPKWTWRMLDGRDQHNDAKKPEVLIINGPSYGEAAE